nr:cytochrome P450 98A1-like [Coffea arabica]XP_027083915.1 cytochrome P450 98A1-like [Coffea arabica]
MVDFLRAKEGRLVSQGEVNIVTIFNMLHNILLSRDLAGLEEEGIESGIKSLVTTAMEVSAAQNELFQAVRDTSTCTIQWKMAELVKNPEKMKQVHEELQREIKHNFLRESHPMQQLPYLEACVKEALQLHPPAPLLLPHHASYNT